jgi:hypothetical protein
VLVLHKEEEERNGRGEWAE